MSGSETSKTEAPISREIPRDEKGKFVHAESEHAPSNTPTTSNPEMKNILKHIETLESQLGERNVLLTKREAELDEVKKRVEKFTEKTREGMKSALNSLMKKWIDSVQTNDVQSKEVFTEGLSRLANTGDADNGVWRMMVAASSLHEQQEHNLDILRKENIELKNRIDGHYAKPLARVQEHVLGKRKAETEPEIPCPTETHNIWSTFASDMSLF